MAPVKISENNFEHFHQSQMKERTDVKSVRVVSSQNFFWPNFNFFWRKSDFLTKQLIFCENFKIRNENLFFWQNNWFLVKNLNFETKLCIFDENLNFWQNNWFLVKILKFATELWIFDKNLIFLEIINFKFVRILGI